MKQLKPVSVNSLNAFPEASSNYWKNLPFMRQLIILTGIVLCCFSCTEKETITINEHENVIIDGNTAPPYAEITGVEIQSYINKLYIDLLGREPDLIELDNATTYLKNNGLTLASRHTYVTGLLNQAAYYNRIWEIYQRAYLNGVTEQQINDQIYAFQLFYDDISQNTDPSSVLLAAYALTELEKLNLLVEAKEAYADGTITIDEYMYRIAFNNIYDEINMGAENMVLSCFENFLKRQPTIAELEAGVTMVDDNQSAQLLLQDGNDKNDFVRIVTSTPEFYQGLVIDIYQQLLVREPSSAEMTRGTEQLLLDKDYQAVQLEVATSDEYAGF